MRKNFIFSVITLMVCAFGFANNETNSLQISKEVEAIKHLTHELDVERYKNLIIENKIVDISYDEVAPCTLRVKVETKVTTLRGDVVASATVEGELTLENCLDIAKIGAEFISSLVQQAVDKVMSQL